jgi:hypothetical protein
MGLFHEEFMKRRERAMAGPFVLPLFILAYEL